MKSTMNSKVNFSYDLKKDAWSWVVIVKSKDLWGLNWRDQIGHIPAELLAEIKKNSFDRSVKIVEKHIRENPRTKFKNTVVKLEMLVLEKLWRSVENEYFKALAKVTQKPIFRNSFGCYFTTGLMCPYREEENWFTVSMWHSIPASITTICHELMHLQFLYHYKNYLKQRGLKNSQIEDLKESLTFLLNEKEFDDIILCDDNGFSEHQKIRKQLQKIWIKERNFEKLLEAGIKLVKRIEKSTTR